MEARAAYGPWQQERPRLVVVHDDGASTYSALPHVVLRDSSISPGSRLLYANLQAYWWKTGLCYASHATLSADLGVSERQIQRYLKELIGAGHITERHHGRGQAKAYAPAQPDTSVVLEPENTTDPSSLDANTTDLSPQHDGSVVPNTTDLSPRRRLREEDSGKKTPPTGEGVAADAAPAPPAETVKMGKRVRSKQPSPDETPAPDTIELSPVSYASALKMGFDREAVELEREHFLAKARSKGWTYVDWKAAFRNWLISEVKYAKRDGRAVGSTRSSVNGPSRPRPDDHLQSTAHLVKSEVFQIGD